MSIATVVTRGFGTFGTIPFVVTRGYSIGAAAIFVEVLQRRLNITLEDRDASVILEPRSIDVTLEAREIKVKIL